MTHEAGYSLPELLVAMGITMVVVAGVFTLTRAAQDAFVAQGEAADMEQRLRVAADSLTKDLVMAGAGSYAGQGVGALGYYFAPVVPYRRGAVRDDPVGTYRSDAITLLYVPSAAVQATIAADLTSKAQTLTLNAGAGCPIGQIACGLKQGDSILIHDGAGNFDTFTLTSVAAGGIAMSVNKPPSAPPTTYRAGSKVVKVVHRTYAIKVDRVSGLYQLVSYDGSTNGDIPVVDHLVGLTFEYFGDPQPPNSLQPPVLLTAAELTDGPWWPDASSANRFDADLLRIRKVAVTLRVEAAVDALRGPAGALFARGGTSTSGTRRLPDEVIRLDVAPRNLNVWRSW